MERKCFWVVDNAIFGIAILDYNFQFLIIRFALDYPLFEDLMHAWYEKKNYYNLQVKERKEAKWHSFSIKSSEIRFDLN